MKNEWLSNFVIGDVTYSNLKSSSYCNYYPLINFSDPIFVVVSNHDELFIMYMLQDRGVLKRGKRVKIKEVLYAKTTYEDILDMFNNKKSINKVIVNSKNASRIGFIGRKKYPEKQIENFNEISNRIPVENVMLDSQIPSKVNIDSIKKVFQSKSNRFGPFSFDKEEENLNFEHTHKKINIENDSSFNFKISEYLVGAMTEKIFKESIIDGEK